MPTPFGEISVPNITPDPVTGIGKWSDDQFYRALHDGIGASGEYLYPVFPFPWYTKLTREDVHSIRAYLMSLPAVNAPRRPLKLGFPASNRGSLLAWRTLFFKPGEFKPDPAASAEVNRGAYLVQGPGHCGECHNQRNEAGSSHWSGNLEGGEIEGWYAPNLTSDKREGVGAWSVEELTHFLKTGSGLTQGVTLGPMQEVVTHSLSHLSDADLRAIAAYLKSVPPKQKFDDRPGSLYAVARSPGAGAYLTYCASCHGLNGDGVAREIPALAGNGAVVAEGPQNVIHAVLGGLPASHEFAPMPAIGQRMTDAEIGAVVDYVRNAWGNAAPATAAPGLVAQIRAATHTAMAGNPDPSCPPVADASIAHALKSAGASAKFAGMTETNMLSVVNTLVPKVKALAPQAPRAAIVNDLTNAYCASLRGTDVPPATRSTRLGDFATFVYGRSRSSAPRASQRGT